jgi:hypothetical protein
MHFYQYLIVKFLTLFLLCSIPSLIADVTLESDNQASSKITLLSRNPFLPGDQRSTQAPTRPTPTAINIAERDLELRAFYEFAGVYYVSVFNRQNQQSIWVSPGQSIQGIQLRDFSPHDRIARVQFQDSNAQLQLKTPSDSPIPIEYSPGASILPTEVGPAINDRPASENRPNVPRRRVILPRPPADS